MYDKYTKLLVSMEMDNLAFAESDGVKYNDEEKKELINKFLSIQKNRLSDLFSEDLLESKRMMDLSKEELELEVVTILTVVPTDLTDTLKAEWEDYKSRVKDARIDISLADESYDELDKEEKDIDLDLVKPKIKINNLMEFLSKFKINLERLQLFYTELERCKTDMVEFISMVGKVTNPDVALTMCRLITIGMDILRSNIAIYVEYISEIMDCIDD
nr:MAG TPA: hypothetical protein [Caudoviricetes sp.]